MNRLLALSVSILCSILMYAGNSVVIDANKSYRLVCNTYGTGSIGIGKYHFTSLLTPYIVKNTELASDCYWNIETVGDGKVRIRNAYDGSYLEYTPAKDYSTYERTKLVITPTDRGVWNVIVTDKGLQFMYVESSTEQYLYISQTKMMVKADKRASDTSYFTLIDASGNKVTPGTTSDDNSNTQGENPTTSSTPGTTTTPTTPGTTTTPTTPGTTTTPTTPGTTTTPTTPGTTTTPTTPGTTTTPTTPGTTTTPTTPGTTTTPTTPGTTTTPTTPETPNKNGEVKSSIVPQGLPILEVTFPGSFKKDMQYVMGSMRLTNVDGSVVELPAKFKTRGATAQNYMMKPSFNMKLRDEQGEERDSTLLGMRSCSSWILDAMAIDRICMRNRVTFDIWNEYAKLPYKTNFDSRNGTIGKYVEVYINKEYGGIYCLSDRINRKLLDLKKVQENEDGTQTVRGVLYKHGTNDIGDQNSTGFSEDSIACVIGYHDAWELTYPEDNAGMQAWQPLFDVYDNLKDYNSIKERFFLENLADYTILIMAFSIGDNWGNKNHYLSVRNVLKDGKKAQFVFTPWDLDTSLGGNYNGTYYDGTYSNWAVKDIAQNAQAPFSTCFRQQEFKDLLKQCWIENRDKALATGSIKKRLYAYRDLLLNSGAWQRQKEYFATQKHQPRLVDDLAKEIDYIVEWYRARHEQMDRYFEISPAGVEKNVTNAPSTDGKYYSISGQELAAPPAKGLYIHNNKTNIK